MVWHLTKLLVDQPRPITIQYHPLPSFNLQWQLALLWTIIERGITPKLVLLDVASMSAQTSQASSLPKHNHKIISNGSNYPPNLLLLLEHVKTIQQGSKPTSWRSWALIPLVTNIRVLPKKIFFRCLQSWDTALPRPQWLDQHVLTTIIQCKVFS